MKPNNNINHALKVYKMWLKHWPRDKSGAQSIANDFLDTRKQRDEFKQLLKLQ
jgi:hypothetical protein